METIRDKSFQILLLLTTIGILFIYGPFIIGDKMYVYLDIGADTYSSYWPYYAFYSDFVREMKWGFWSFNFGLGGNILTFHSLLLDPFNIILFLFNKESLDYGLVVVTILKIYTVSLFAYKFLKLFKISNYALILATISYTFSSFFIVWGQHYHFATMFVLFTVLVYYAEQWIRERKFKVLVLIFVLTAINSPYFLYTICLFLLVYILIRYCFENKIKWKEFLVFILQTASVFLLGFMIGAILLIPEVNIMLGSSRVGANLLPQLQLSSIQEYISIVSSMLSNNLLGTHYFNGYGNYYEAPHLFIGTLILLIFPRLFLKNFRNKYVVLSGLIVLALLFLPSFFNPIFNALSDYTFRWTFCLFPIFSLALAKAITLVEKDKLENKSPIKYIISMYITIMVFLFLIFLQRDIVFLQRENIDIIKTSFIFLIVSLTGYVILLCLNWSNTKRARFFKTLILVVVLVELFSNSYISVVKRSIISAETKDEIPYFDNTNNALEFIKSQDQGFYRVFKTYSKIDLNDALFQDYYSEKLYNSLNNENILEFGKQFDVRNKNSLHYLVGYDEKLDLYNLLSFKYMLTKQKEEYFGFEYIGSFGDVHAYKNIYALPLAFLYENSISEEAFEQLNVEQKLINIFYHYVATGKENNDLGLITTTQNEQVRTKNEIYTEGIIVVENNFPNKLDFISESYDPIIIFTLDETSATPLKVKFTATSEAGSNGRLYYKTIDGIFNEENSVPFQLLEGEYEYSLEINMLNISEIRLDLSDSPGKYLLENLIVESKDKAALEAQKDILRNKGMDISYFSENNIIGEINTEKEVMLFFSIPYDEGWKAKINGKAVPVNKINYGFLGVDIPSGNSKVELYYEQKGFKLGMYISLVSILVYIVLFIRKRKGNIG